MDTLVINGGRELSGKVKIPGAKNTVLPILAATVISGKKSILSESMLFVVQKTSSIIRQWYLIMVEDLIEWGIFEFTMNMSPFFTA